MKKKRKYSVSGDLGFVEVLTLLFIALKLCGVISWSWLWVLAPVWITFAIIGVIGLLIFLLGKISRRRI